MEVFFFRYKLSWQGSSQSTYSRKSSTKISMTWTDVYFNVHGILRMLDSSYCSLLAAWVSWLCVLRTSHRVEESVTNEFTLLWTFVCLCVYLWVVSFYSFHSIDDRLFLSNQVGVTSQLYRFDIVLLHDFIQAVVRLFRL